MRNALDNPTEARPRAELFLALYMMLDRVQICADALARLREAQALIDQLIASYEAVATSSAAPIALARRAAGTTISANNIAAFNEQ